MDDIGDGEKERRVLRLNPALTISRAKRGSFNDIIALSQEAHDFPAIQTEEVVKIFCSHLDVSRIPRDSDYPVQYSSGYILAGACIGGLHGLLEAERPKSIVSIANAWPGIFEWMNYFMSDTPEQPPAMEDRPIIPESITDVINVLSFHKDTQSVVLRTPNLLTLVASIWMKEDTPDFTLSACNTFCRVICDPDSGKKPSMLEIFTGAGWSAGEVAKQALSRLQYALWKGKDEDAVIDTLCAEITLMTHFFDLKRDALFWAIFRHRGIVVLTDVLLRLTSLHRFNDARIMDSISACFLFPCLLVEVDEGIREVCQVLQHGLLRALLDIGPVFDQIHQGTQRSIVLFVEEVLPKYAAFRSVMVALGSAMVPLQPSGSSVAVGRSHIKDIWGTLDRTAVECARILHHLDVPKDVSRCDVCTRSAPKSTMKRCARCHMTVYCSKSCQTAAWKASHKTDCKVKLQERIDFLKEYSLGTSDLAFHRRLVDRNARASVPTLRVMASKDFPGVPLAALGVTLQYTRSLHPLPALFLLSGTKVTGWDNPSIVTALSQGHSTLVESVMALGKASKSIMVVLPSIWHPAPVDVQQQLDLQSSKKS